MTGIRAWQVGVARRHRVSGDAGSVTLFFAITGVGLMVLLGLIVDGGAKIRAIQRADTLAAEAARAGGQAIDLPPTIAGRRPLADPAAAATAARTYLSGHAATGTVTVTRAGRRLDVTTTASSPTVFLALIGIGSITVHGHAAADLAFGTTGAQP